MNNTGTLALALSVIAVVLSVCALVISRRPVETSPGPPAVDRGYRTPEHSITTDAETAPRNLGPPPSVSVDAGYNPDEHAGRPTPLRDAPAPPAEAVPQAIRTDMGTDYLEGDGQEKVIPLSPETAETIEQYVAATTKLRKEFVDSVAQREGMATSTIELMIDDTLYVKTVIVPSGMLPPKRRLSDLYESGSVNIVSMDPAAETFPETRYRVNLQTRRPEKPRTQEPPAPAPAPAEERLPPLAIPTDGAPR